MIIKQTFPVLGMSCASCAARVDKTLNGQPGVQEASVNYASATAQVTFDDEVCSPSILKAVVQYAGYDLLIDAQEEALKLGNSKVFNVIVLGVAAKHMDFTKEQWLSAIEATVPPKTVELNKKAFLVGYEM